MLQAVLLWEKSSGILAAEGLRKQMKTGYRQWTIGDNFRPWVIGDRQWGKPSMEHSSMHIAESSKLLVKAVDCTPI